MEGQGRAIKDDLSNATEDVPNLAETTSSGANVEIGSAEGEHQETDGMSSSSNNSLGASSTASGNPLENPVILNHLFRLCPVATVASCRLVSKLWYDESLVTWRTASPLTMVMENTQILVGRSTPLQEFMEFSANLDNRCVSLPYRNLQINENAPLRLNLLSEELKIFLSSVGINLTTLNLSSCTFRSIEKFRQIIYTACPVLQKLGIRSCTFTFQMASGRGGNNELDYVEPLYGEHKLMRSLTVAMEDDNFPVSWIELFSHFPSLEYFQCTNSWMELPESQVETLIHAIQAIRKNDKKKLPLKHFQIDPEFKISWDLTSHQRFALVKELRLPLKSCSINLHSEMGRSFWNNTLEYLAASVSTIKLLSPEDVVSENACISTSRNFAFVIQLNNLTRLELRGDRIHNFQFLKYTPNLSTLNISDIGMFKFLLDGVGTDTSYTEMVRNTCKEELANLEMTRLTTFELRFGVYDDDIHYLYRWMPNITNLAMVLNDYQFSMVCLNLKYLRKLTVMVKAYDDKPLTEEGVTGMGRGKEFGIRPVIANLEALESLILDLRLTTESVFHLFLHLPTLKILHHSVCTMGDETHVQREDLDDLSSYQRAISRCSYYATNVGSTPLPTLFYNVIEQWVAENPDGLSEKLTDSGRMVNVPGRKPHEDILYG